MRTFTSQQFIKNADYQLFFPNIELQVLNVEYYTGFICFNI